MNREQCLIAKRKRRMMLVVSSPVWILGIGGAIAIVMAASMKSSTLDIVVAAIAGGLSLSFAVVVGVAYWCSAIYSVWDNGPRLCAKNIFGRMVTSELKAASRVVVSPDGRHIAISFGGRSINIDSDGWILSHGSVADLSRLVR